MNWQKVNKEGADSKTKVHLDRILGCQCDGAYKKATLLVVDNPQDSQEFISYKDPPNFYQSKSESDQCIEAEVKSKVLYYPEE